MDLLSVFFASVCNVATVSTRGWTYQPDAYYHHRLHAGRVWSEIERSSVYEGLFRGFEAVAACDDGEERG